ncbi:ABC transporter ATP-binding protein [Aliiroseovarius sp.]|uniref:ABC transporter ATP-binding protein n=1 Tax=Aliiroseovarius sp. TaxID=1872442 RepID=UPI002626963E|nr:ABC transporter ATP-binding protein [Aliiroseovarius sp.]
MSVLTLDRLSVTLRTRSIFSNVSLRVAPGEFVGLIGPNGAGKTTLMRAALGLIPSTGRSSLAALTARDRARAVAWMPQSREIAWPIPVERLVALGAEAAGHSPTGRAGQTAIEAAMSRMGLTSYKGRAASRLSGGEQARALIARALAQDTPLLMADEPIAGLDPAHQISTMEVFAALAAEGRAALVSLHDLGLAARHCTRLVLLAEGGILADGTPAEVLTPENMARAFGVSVWHRQTGDGPIFQPLEVL